MIRNSERNKEAGCRNITLKVRNSASKTVIVLCIWDVRCEQVVSVRTRTTTQNYRTQLIDIALSLKSTYVERSSYSGQSPKTMLVLARSTCTMYSLLTPAPLVSLAPCIANAREMQRCSTYVARVACSSPQQGVDTYSRQYRQRHRLRRVADSTVGLIASTVVRTSKVPQLVSTYQRHFFFYDQQYIP